MSFIFGIIDFNHQVSSDDISRLANAVKWDGFIEFVEIHKNVAVGICTHPDRKSNATILKYKHLIVVADYKIYNLSFLKKELNFSNENEVFAHAYLKWGKECASRINGDFSVVIIDQNTNRIHLFRDHIGVRPLAYWFDGNKLVFASHEFGIAKSKLIQVELCKSKILKKFIFRNVAYGKTVFKNVLKIIPGHTYVFSLKKVTVFKYWRPERIKKDKNLTFNESVAHIRSLLIKAIDNRIENEKNGVHVSGGLDSTGIAAILAERLGNKDQLYGYSWNPEGDFNSENDIHDNVEGLIRSFSREKGIKVRFLKFEENEFFNNTIIPEFEEMNIEIPTMKRAGKDEVATMFSGWGGDEFVSISNRGTYNHLFFTFQWGELIKLIKIKGIKLSISKSFSEILPLFSIGIFNANKTISKQRFRFLKLETILWSLYLIIVRKSKNVYGFGNRTKFMINLLEQYHLPNRMDSWAMFAEKYGFNYRYPLLDKDLLEFWFAIPVKYTCIYGKSRLLYREAMKGILEEDIRNRSDKSDSQFFEYLTKLRIKERAHMTKLYRSVPKDYTIPGFNKREFDKLANKVERAEEGVEVPQMGMLLYYRYRYELETKYLK